MGELLRALGRASAATSTCTRCHRSPGCSRSATAAIGRRSTSRVLIDGDVVRIGGIRIGADATVGARAPSRPARASPRRDRPGSAVSAASVPTRPGKLAGGRVGGVVRAVAAAGPGAHRWLWAYAAPPSPRAAAARRLPPGLGRPRHRKRRLVAAFAGGVARPRACSRGASSRSVSSGACCRSA